MSRRESAVGILGKHQVVDQKIWAQQMMPRLDGCLGELTPKAREVLKLRKESAD